MTIQSSSQTVCRSAGLRVAVILAAWIALGSKQAPAQPTCPFDSAATEYLAANGVTARLAASKTLFFGHQYEVPAGSGIRAIFFADLLLGGLVDGELRVIASRSLSDDQIRPGPLSETGNPPSDCRPYNKVFKVTLADVLEFEETGVANEDLTDWPWQLGAPVEDGDGIEGNYDLAAGDRPFVEGHEKLWWILNDVGNPPSVDHIPLGVEIQTSAFALASDDPVLDYATFYRYHITYRGDGPLTDAFFGMHLFSDLGYVTDNYLGSDTTLGLAYVYNGDDFDGSTSSYPGYGDRPPAVGMAIVEGILANSDLADNDHDGLVDEPDERIPMTTVSDPDLQDPKEPLHYYRLLQSIWPDGQHLTYGGSGRGFSTTHVDFLFPGEPGDFWSEEDIDGNGSRNTPSQRRLYWSTGPFSMDTGESRDILVAILWAQGDDRYDSVRLLKESVPKVRDYYASGFDIPAISAPSTAPTLYAPADGAEGQPQSLRLSWRKQPDHQRHELLVSRDPDFSEIVDSAVLSSAEFNLDLATDATFYWKVRGRNSLGRGPWSETWKFSTGLVSPTAPGALDIDGNETWAFVQVEGGEGEIDACGVGAASTFGCAETGGNWVYGSFSGAATWVMYHSGPGPEDVIGRYAPHDFELRFTEEGSYAYYAQTTGRVIHVPFEAWDIGDVGPFGLNDPEDDLQLIPGLYADDGGECVFGFGETPDDPLGLGWPTTDRIFAFYTSGGSTYDDWRDAVEPLVQSDVNGCPQPTAADSVSRYVDTLRMPLQNLIFMMNPTADSYRPEGIPTGNVIRFLTTRPSPPIPSAPADESSILHGADPNGLSLWWQLPHGTGKSRLQVTQITPVNSVVVDSVVEGSSFTLPDPNLGLYTWRVGYTTESEFWSEPWSFDVFSIASTENELAEFPAVLTLRRPYPNPTSDVAHLDIGLPSTDRITLTAFDLLGRRVATIADMPMTAGWRTVDWNTADVSNGVYVVRVEAGKAAVSTKVVVVK